MPNALIARGRAWQQGTSPEYEREQLRLAEHPESEVWDPAYTQHPDSMFGSPNAEAEQAKLDQALATSLSIGSKVTKMLMAGELAPQSIARLPRAATALDILRRGAPADRVLPPEGVRNEAQREVAVDLPVLRKLSDQLRTPKAGIVDPGDLGARQLIDYDMYQQAVKNDPNINPVDPRASMYGGGLTNYPQQAGKVADIGIWEPTLEILADKIRAGTPAANNPPSYGTYKRAVLAHEQGERSMIQGEKPILPFASHMGPEARMREWQILSMRDPEFAKAAMDYSAQIPSEKIFNKAYRQAGGTSLDPIQSDSRQAEAVARIMRRMKQQDPGFKRSRDNFVQRGILPPEKPWRTK